MIIFTNIPSSYRGFLFKKISEYLLKDNIKLKVMYSRITETGRNFDLSEAFDGYNYSIDNNGIYYSIFRNYHIHLNPFFIYFCLKMLLKGKTVILSASWWSLNNLIIIFFSNLLKIFKSNFYGNLGYWMEESPKIKNGSFVINKLKTLIYFQIDFFIVPGDYAYKKIEKIICNYSSKKKPIFKLPNLIDNKKFSRLNVLSENKKIPKKNITILIVARLVDKRKGISQFIKSVSSSECFRENFQLQIVGSGPDKEKIKKIINENRLSSIINFLGNCKYDQVSNLMRNADVFCLPSFLDPSPLSLVEAAFSELPLIVSKFCGNNKELLEHEKNGYLIDPMNYESPKKAIDWIYRNKSKLREKGKLSREIALRNYDTDIVINKLIFSMKRNNYLN